MNFERTQFSPPHFFMRLLGNILKVCRYYVVKEYIKKKIPANSVCRTWLGPIGDDGGEVGVLFKGKLK